MKSLSKFLRCRATPKFKRGCNVFVNLWVALLLMFDLQHLFRDFWFQNLYRNTFFPYCKIPASDCENDIFEKWWSLHSVNKSIMDTVYVRWFLAWSRRGKKVSFYIRIQIFIICIYLLQLFFSHRVGLRSWPRFTQWVSWLRVNVNNPYLLIPNPVL